MQHVLKDKGYFSNQKLHVYNETSIAFFFTGIQCDPASFFPVKLSQTGGYIYQLLKTWCFQPNPTTHDVRRAAEKTHAITEAIKQKQFLLAVMDTHNTGARVLETRLVHPSAISLGATER